MNINSDAILFYDSIAPPSFLLWDQNQISSSADLSDNVQRVRDNYDTSPAARGFSVVKECSEVEQLQ